MSMNTHGTLILVRHGESQWNARNVWTGLTDIGLSDKGKIEAACAGKQIADIAVSCAFTSALSRAQQTLQIIIDTIGKPKLSVEKNAALNERDYGIYTGKNKLEVKASLGEDGYIALRRGWDIAVPQGESLKEVSNRVLPFYQTCIEPLVQAGKTVLIVAHGNSLRTIIKYIEHISDTDISNVELKTGEIIIYQIAPDGSIVQKMQRYAAM